MTTEQKELRLQTGNGWTCESPSLTTHYVPSIMPISTTTSTHSRCETEDNDNDISDIDFLLDSKNLNNVASIAPSVNKSYHNTSTSNGLSQIDVRLLTATNAESNGPTNLLGSNRFETQIVFDTSNKLDGKREEEEHCDQNQCEKSFLINQYEDALRSLQSVEVYCDPLQLPHPKYQFSNSAKSLSQMVNNHSYGGFKTGQQFNKGKTLHNQKRFHYQSSQKIIKQLNIDLLSVFLCMLSIIFCSSIYYYLLPNLEQDCLSLSYRWILWSNMLSISGALSGTIYLIGWYFITKSRFYRKQTIFVTASVLVLAIASANALWAVSAFLKLDCHQALAIQNTTEEKHQLSFTNLYQELKSNSNLINYYDIRNDKGVNEIKEASLTIEPQLTIETTTNLIETNNMKTRTIIRSVVRNVLPQSSPNLPTWLYLILIKYDLKVAGVFHWLIALLMVGFVLRLMAKRRRFYINSLKKANILTEYYWAIMD